MVKNDPYEWRDSRRRKNEKDMNKSAYRRKEENEKRLVNNSQSVKKRLYVQRKVNRINDKRERERERENRERKEGI